VQLGKGQKLDDECNWGGGVVEGVKSMLMGEVSEMGEVGERLRRRELGMLEGDLEREREEEVVILDEEEEVEKG
jgi:hypothetical protein